ncbi:hypothetical protein KN248_005240 [Mycobacterium paraintracellulare]|uniref:hypothetical protein n=1 Tax=Mycobacterium avium complex (MAC) TaxID=120793 RepID=UPI001155639D|nr:MULTISPECIES: hypothetical protein [Mycobacterium avium complex (MAC)]WVL49478.1 hypothetical protein KN248_005240 [Mycobacterium paraintracellulare]
MDRNIIQFDREIDDVVVRVIGIFEHRFHDQTRARNQLGVFAQVSQKILERRQVLIFEAVSRSRTSAPVVMS